MERYGLRMDKEAVRFRREGIRSGRGLFPALHGNSVLHEKGERRDALTERVRSGWQESVTIADNRDRSGELHKCTVLWSAKGSKIVCVESLNVASSYAWWTPDASPGRFPGFLKWKCRRAAFNWSKRLLPYTRRTRLAQHAAMWTPNCNSL